MAVNGDVLSAPGLEAVPCPSGDLQSVLNREEGEELVQTFVQIYLLCGQQNNLGVGTVLLTSRWAQRCVLSAWQVLCAHDPMPIRLQETIVAERRQADGGSGSSDPAPCPARGDFGVFWPPPAQLCDKLA